MIAAAEKKDAPGRVRTVPEGYHSVTPFIIVKGAGRLLDFTSDAFGAKEISRMPNPDGTISHAETRIGDSVIMMFDSKEGWPKTPGFLRLYVNDCDSTYQQALKTGASSVTKPTNMPWGDRVCRIRDPLGNIWWIMTRVEEVNKEEIEKRFGQKEYLEAMQYVQNAVFFPAEEKSKK